MAFPSNMQLSVQVDNQTVVFDSSDQLSVKDIAINGNASDLASTRGTFDTLTKGSVDCNTLTDQGVYAISLTGTVNGPGFSSKLIVFNGKNNKFTNQMALSAGAGTSDAVRVTYRARNSEENWSPWSEGILSGRIGDGIRVTNGIISVPEYQGAVTTTTGVAGLVPPATGQKFAAPLLGNGDFSYEQPGNYIQVAGGTLNIFEHPNFISMFTTGNIVINAIPSTEPTIYNRCYTLVFEEAGNTVLTWPGNTVWVDTAGEAPVWGGMSGRKLVVILMVVFRKLQLGPMVFASTIYNEMAE